MTNWLRTVVGAALVACVVLLAAVQPAGAATPCWKRLLNDWYDGRIDHTYAIGCYHEALSHLPTDVQTYSSAKDDISRALQDALAADHRAHRRTTRRTLVPPQQDSPTTTTTAVAAGGGVGGGSGGGSSGGGSSGPTGTLPGDGLPGNRPKGGISKLADTLNPSNPSSLPVPLLVLGGLALLLVAAGGAGVAAKRWQNRP